MGSGRKQLGDIGRFKRTFNVGLPYSKTSVQLGVQLMNREDKEYVSSSFTHLHWYINSFFRYGCGLQPGYLEGF